jgi:hypothetical protein
LWTTLTVIVAATLDSTHSELIQNRVVPFVHVCDVGAPVNVARTGSSQPPATAILATDTRITIAVTIIDAAVRFIFFILFSFIL